MGHIVRGRRAAWRPPAQRRPAASAGARGAPPGAAAGASPGVEAAELSQQGCAGRACRNLLCGTTTSRRGSCGGLCTFRAGKSRPLPGSGLDGARRRKRTRQLRRVHERLALRRPEEGGHGDDAVQHGRAVAGRLRDPPRVVHDAGLRVAAAASARACRRGALPGRAGRAATPRCACSAHAAARARVRARRLPAPQEQGGQSLVAAARQAERIHLMTCVHPTPHSRPLPTHGPARVQPEP